MQSITSSIRTVWQHQLTYWQDQHRKNPKDRYARRQLEGYTRLLKESKVKN